jgi:phage-related protein
MARIVAYAGTKLTIAYAREASGESPGFDFFERGLPKHDPANFRMNQARLMKLFQLLGDNRIVHNREKFGDLGDGLFEFKSFQIRMPYAYARHERALVLITHGFIKKQNKTPKQEIARAWRILNEDQGATGLAVVSRNKR